jgi:hypothetical protein
MFTILKHTLRGMQSQTRLPMKEDDIYTKGRTTTKKTYKISPWEMVGP